jgi:hypothetical protein
MTVVAACMAMAICARPDTLSADPKGLTDLTEARGTRLTCHGPASNGYTKPGERNFQVCDFETQRSQPRVRRR